MPAMKDGGQATLPCVALRGPIVEGKGRARHACSVEAICRGGEPSVPSLVPQSLTNPEEASQGQAG